MSKGILAGSISQSTSAVHITYSKARDARPEERAELTRALRAMYRQCYQPREGSVFFELTAQKTIIINHEGNEPGGEVEEEPER